MRRILKIKKGSYSEKKQEEVKGCLVLAEAAIPSPGGQDRLKEAKETKRRESRQLARWQSRKAEHKHEPSSGFGSLHQIIVETQTGCNIPAIVTIQV